MDYKLGKTKYEPNKKDLAMKMYVIGAKLPDIPVASYPFKAFNGDLRMLENDKYGCCVWSGAYHEHMIWNAESGKAFNCTDQNVLDAYSAVTGFKPDDPSTDNGTNVRDALNYRRNVGLKDANNQVHKLDAFLNVNAKDIEQLKTAVYLFDAVGIGIAVYDYMMEQFEDGKEWAAKKSGKLEGYHYVPVVGYDKRYLYVITWGKIQKLRIGFYNRINDETWALLGQDFLKDGRSPDGLDLETLRNDLKALA